MTSPATSRSRTGDASATPGDEVAGATLVAVAGIGTSVLVARLAREPQASRGGT